ncbi:hypothetical protein [Desulfosporosinus sp.]|uniref:hypothetical protein n=1 Tax=Desulfosporosinus sp. TaxID=157907 RepID=UPI00261C8A4F|nr:hypothetical protein [Desulfosporosinus sp.]
MKNFKKLIAAATIVGVLGVTGVAYAGSESTPAGIAAGLTGKSVEEIMALRAAGTTYGAIVNEAGKLDEFKVQTLKQKKIILDQRVKDGNLTQAQADQIYASIKTNQVNCDATGSAGTCKSNGVGFGKGQGMVKGAGQNNGGGFGARLNR